MRFDTANPSQRNKTSPVMVSEELFYSSLTETPARESIVHSLATIYQLHANSLLHINNASGAIQYPLLAIPTFRNIIQFIVQIQDVLSIPSIFYLPI